MTVTSTAPGVRVDELMRGVEEIQAAGAKTKAEAAAKAGEAKAAAEQIQAARAQGEAATAEARTKASGRLLDAMRQLTDEVRQAREAAAEAIRTGTQPLEAWLRYRAVRGHNRGVWSALGAQYAAVTASGRFPPGEWGPDVIQLRNDAIPMQVPVESFADFLNAVAFQMEQAIQGDADAATRREIAQRGQ